MQYQSNEGFGVLGPVKFDLNDSPDFVYSPAQHRVRSTKVILDASETELGTPTFLAVLGQVTATGKYKISRAAASDGSQAPKGIMLAEGGRPPVGVDKEVMLAITGDFFQDAVVIGEGHSLSSIKSAMEDLGIFFVRPRL